MSSYLLIPKVDPTQEFVEIAYDFSNPLDIVREAISNAFDAGANRLEVIFEVKSEYGEKILITTLRDNGNGMDQSGLQSFFDLGNSLNRENENAIGEKGHGTKVYLNSAKIEVQTVRDGLKYNAVMESPIRQLHDRKIPEVNVTYDTTNEDNGTTIRIIGYNNNRREKFTHAILKDYIKWFTKIGSIELELGLKNNENVILILKGIDKNDPEEIKFGHFFPEKSKSVATLFDEYLVDAPKWYCNRIKRSGNLENFPEIKYDAVFYIEGTKVKYDYNPMIRRSGYTAPKGAYTIQERYGLWLCKDYIPIQKKNEWITQKGSEYTRFHAFINCQELRLTANRGSVDNTPYEILEDLKKVVDEIYTDIIQSDDWRNIEWLENEVTQYNTIQNEKKDFKWRIDRVKSSKIANYNGVRLVEPRRESGVFSLFMMLDLLDKNLFPFTIIDYDTHSGIDLIVKAKDTIPIVSSKLFYVEFKYYLEKHFNHSFENLHSIICWDIDSRIAKHGDEIEDIAKVRRTLKIIQPSTSGDYTRYFLDDSYSNRKIEIFVLKQYLKEKCGIDFRPRTGQDTL